MKLLRPLPLALALATLFAGSVQAQNLVQMYEAARGYDAGYQSARAQYDASIARADQANALILPTVNAAAGYSQTQFENKTGNNIVIDTSFGTENASISASQPLYRPANLAGYEQGRKQVDIAKAQLDAIEQDLIVRVSTAYFDVLSAQDNLFLIREQKKAVAEQLASAKRNFEVGTATITDTREAEARYDLILASEIGAENDLRVKRLALEVVVGKAANDPKPLARPVTLPAIPLTDDAFWINQAVVNNPTLRQARLGVDVAKLETEKAYAGHKPTLDLTASYGNTRYPGGNASSGFYTRTTSGTLGLALNIPLFAGFAVENRVKETLSLEQKAKADLDSAERTVVQGTRAIFFGVKSGLGQIKALETAELSTKSALDANILGYQVGVRINLDVLNSQSLLFVARRDLDLQRYNVLLNSLKLRQAAGTLKPEDLEQINALLVK
jgi:outer membrane protein